MGRRARVCELLRLVSGAAAATEEDSSDSGEEAN